MLHIFISYKSQQREIAFNIRDLLQSWGYETWLDADDLQNESDWMTEIDAALKSATAIIGLLTPASLVSRYVTGEWDIAIISGIPFILLEFESTSVYGKYADTRPIDFTGRNWVEASDELRRRLHDVLTSPALRPHHEYFDYLTDLYSRLSQAVAARTISTLRTYGSEGQRAAEPIRLQIEADGHIKSDILALMKDVGGQAWLVGEPGAGKTMALLNYARDAVVSCMQDPDSPIPILASIADWNPDEETPLVDWLGGLSSSPDDTVSLINSGEALLLLDALDELGDKRPVDPKQPDGESYDPRVRFLKVLDKLPGDSLVLMSSRTEAYDTVRSTLEFGKRLLLLPMDDNRIGEYLRDQPELLTAITEDAELRSVLQTPLLLSFFAFAYEGMSSEERDQFKQLRNAVEIRDKIFAHFVKQRYEHEARRPSASLPFTLEKMTDVLGQLAYEDVRRSVKNRDDKSEVLRSDFKKLVQSHMAADFTKLAIQLQVLVEEGEYRMRFVHLLLRNALAYPLALTRIEDEQDYRQWSDNALVLGHIGDERAIAPILEAFKDVEPRAEKQFNQIVQSLLATVDPQAMAIGLERSHPVGVRIAVATALGEIGGAQAVETLVAWNELALEPKWRGTALPTTIKDALVRIGHHTSQTDEPS